jgi:transposase
MDPPLCAGAALGQNESDALKETLGKKEDGQMKKELSVIGMDLAKSVFQVVGMDHHGAVVLRKRLSREALMAFIAQLLPTLIGLEACGSAHYWARQFREHGHEVKLISPQFVRPDVKSNKNDLVDAEAICEALTRPTMRFVPIKTVEQQDWQAVHRVRERLVAARTALVNEIRSLLAEYGIVLPKGITRFRAHVVECCERHTDQLSPLGQELFQQLYEEFVALDGRITYYLIAGIVRGRGAEVSCVPCRW